MMDNSVNILGDTEYEIIELLQDLNVPRTEAICIACLLGGDELTSQTIERTSGLRQPEVSVAMRPLRERGWIIERDEKKTNGKGRPVKHYTLTVQLKTIVETFEGDIRKQNDEMMDSINRLRELRLS